MAKVKTGIKGIVLLLVGIIVFASVALPAYASGDLVQFTVLPIYPDNQTDRNLGYLDLKVEPNTTQELQLMVSNRSSEDIIVSVGAASASTTRSGVVDYTTPDVSDETLKHSFSQLATVGEEQITIPANGERVVSISLTTPKESFDGIILGGLRVTNITDRLKRAEEKESSTDLRMSIYNEYEYVIAVVLHENENIISPNFELGDVYLGTDNHRAAVIADIRNTEAYLAKDLTYSAAVSLVGSEQKIFSVEGAEVSFAPNSVMSYAFSDEIGTGIGAGSYVYTANLTDGKQVWEFSREFTIEQETAKAVNEKAVNQQQNVSKSSNSTLLIMMIIALVVVLLILIAILTLRKR